MKSKILGLVAAGLLMGSVGAQAAAVNYTISFTGGGILPTSGSFTYDDVNGFSNFFVGWNGRTYDLTSFANDPFLAGTGCGFAAGAAGAFALMSNPGSSTCSNTQWNASMGTSSSVFSFISDQASNRMSIRSLNGGAGQPAGAVGQWTIAPSEVPLPAAAWLLLSGLGGLGLLGRRKTA